MLLVWRRIWRQRPDHPLSQETTWNAVTLAALLMLWNLSVPMALEERLIGATELDPVQQQTLRAKPARLPPLQEGAWATGS
ncbi:MAG: hypothetical protein FJ078_06905 [Cyanobacteria bacterium K_DeepCast_35m_m2_155]|nr:hypothetical protein [Cyanobacteria bacterium K_DeepCast_35m_m2_155]